MQRKEPRILLDAEVLVKLAYLTISEDVDLRNLETLRLTYEQGNEMAGNKGLEVSLELTPLDELRRLCEQVLASEEVVEE
ncbi:MAG: hypothetical protein QXJ45_05490 [Thermoproteota archaeon]